MPAPTTLPATFAPRWERLARAVGLAPDEPVLVALSGGADSVLLVHLVAVAEPRPALRAVHVEHGLRGDEGRADAAFCARLCRALGVPLVRRAVHLDPDGPSLEARARTARYAVLAEEARAAGVRTVLTGHHADDALETLLMRWVRGTHLGGLAGLRTERGLDAPAAADEAPQGAADALRVVRPLIGMRREEVRRLLADHGLAWREDRSNRSPRFTRNRVRHGLLPELAAVCGRGAIDNLRAFGRAVEAFEERLAAGTAHLSWSPPAHAAARHPRAEGTLGGALPRAELMRLVPPLRRRALWRLVYEGTGRPPSRRLLDLILGDLASARCTRHSLPARWSLQLRSDRLHLLPPAQHLARCTIPSEPATAARQLALPFDPPAAGAREPHPADPALGLAVPGVARLPDGRQVTAEWVEALPGRAVPRSPLAVELDLGRRAAHELTVRYPGAGDRFHPLGAPGRRRLTRFLADAGVPREDRPRVPLVCAGDEVIWVCGLRPSEPRRVRPETRRRLLLTLHEAAEPEPRAEPEPALFPSVRAAV